MTSRNPWGIWLAATLSWGILSSDDRLLCKARAQEQAIQEQATEDSYNYIATGKRDPFFPPFRMVETETDATAEPKTPLQRFDIGQLKLVGVIWKSEEPVALIEDSGGLGYIVTRGTLIGSKGGIIKTIEQKRIVIEEYQTDFFGKRQVQERELRLVVTEASRDDKKPAR